MATTNQTNKAQPAGTRMRAEVKLKAVTEDLKRRVAKHTDELQVAGVGTWDWDLLKNTLICCEQYVRLCGLEPIESTVKTFEEWKSCIHPKIATRGRQGPGSAGDGRAVRGRVPRGLAGRDHPLARVSGKDASRRDGKARADAWCERRHHRPKAGRGGLPPPSHHRRRLERRGHDPGLRGPAHGLEPRGRTNVRLQRSRSPNNEHPRHRARRSLRSVLDYLERIALVITSSRWRRSAAPKTAARLMCG